MKLMYHTKFILFSFLFRNMSGVSFGSTTSFRQPATVTTPQELCDFLGGKRVIHKVINDGFFELI